MCISFSNILLSGMAALFKVGDSAAVIAIAIKASFFAGFSKERYRTGKEKKSQLYDSLKGTAIIIQYPE